MIELDTPQAAHRAISQERQSEHARATTRDRAYFLLRITLGVNLAVHGAIRLTNLDGFAAALVARFAGTPLPDAAVDAFARGVPAVELLVGLGVMLGLYTEVALLTGAALMAVLTLGAGLVRDWSVMGTQLVYSITYFALLWAIPHNRISLDRLRG